MRITRLLRRILIASMPGLLVCATAWATALPDCSRPLSLALHEHGLLYSRQSGEGIDKDIADELIRRSGCAINVTVLPRARIWQLIESGGLDFSLSGISNENRERFAAFAWYFSNKYYLLVRRDAGVQQVGDFAKNPELRLGAIRSFRYSPAGNRLLDSLEAEQRVSFASGLAPLYEILLANQVQGMIIEPFDYPALESSRIRAQTAILEFEDAPVPHGLIMSKRTLPPREQAKWRALMDGMRADGSVERIFEKYFKPELARALTRF